MTIISLFSGAGGLDLGLIQAGNNVIWANDIDADAVATYKANINDHIIQADIQTLTLQKYHQQMLLSVVFLAKAFQWQI